MLLKRLIYLANLKSDPHELDTVNSKIYQMV